MPFPAAGRVAALALVLATAVGHGPALAGGCDDADADGVVDAVDRCPGGDDRVDADRNGTPDACEELAARATIDDFDGYASDAALAAVWDVWGPGADVAIARAPAAGERATTALELRPLGPDGSTGGTWASLSRGFPSPPGGAHDGVILRVDHAGGAVALGVTVVESSGEPWGPAGVAVDVRSDGAAWSRTAPGDANGVVQLPADFHGLVRLRFAELAVPAWYVGAGDRRLESGRLASVLLGTNVTGHVGERLLIDSLAFWYAVDPAIAGRVARRDWPSIAQPWNGVDDEPGVDARDLLARHDVYWHAPTALRLAWDPGALFEPCTPEPGGGCLGLATAFTAASRPLAAAWVADLRQRNPNLVLLAEIRYHDAWPTYLPAGHRFWQRDGQGNRIVGWAEGGFYLLDWHQPALRSLVAAQARAAVEQGGVDGIFLDWWDDTDDDRVALVETVRAAIGSRLLVVNNNDRVAPRSAPWVNGIYMEGYRSATVEDWQRLADTLAWAESALRRPHVTTLETWFATGRTELDRMRATTTLALTRSDGYALFGDPNDLPTPDHRHTWYPFWSLPLGVPLGDGTPAQDGSWRREFTGGTVVYNPMGNPTAHVAFPTPKWSAASGAVGVAHEVAARDGDVFLPLP